MKPFWALRVHSSEGKTPYAKLEQMSVSDLTPGDVVVETHYSAINYKDALAVSGRGKIIRKFPLNAGIDVAGIVLESQDSRYKPGMKVLVTGCGIGENDDGGFAEVTRAKGDSIVPLPSELNLRDAMILGTAGFTAALARHRMEMNQQRPTLGPMLITGASGGVGSFAVQIFSQAGYDVHAVSGKPDMRSYLTDLGASEVLTPAELELGTKSLESVRFGGAVDNVGGQTLAKILAHVQQWGNVASIGLAESAEFSTTVMPFILRGVSLLGISSNNCRRDLRVQLWQRLATDWRPPHLDRIVTKTVELKDVVSAATELLDRKTHGRILVQIRSGK